MLEGFYSVTSSYGQGNIKTQSTQHHILFTLLGKGRAVGLVATPKLSVQLELSSWCYFSPSVIIRSTLDLSPQSPRQALSLDTDTCFFVFGKDVPEVCLSCFIFGVGSVIA